MVMSGKGSHQLVMLWVDTFDRPRERLERRLTLFASFGATVRRNTTCHVFVALTKLARWTVVVVGAGDDVPVDGGNQIRINRSILRQRTDPAICLYCCPG